MIEQQRREWTVSLRRNAAAPGLVRGCRYRIRRRSGALAEPGGRPVRAIARSHFRIALLIRQCDAGVDVDADSPDGANCRRDARVLLHRKGAVPVLAICAGAGRLRSETATPSVSHSPRALAMPTLPWRCRSRRAAGPKMAAAPRRLRRCFVRRRELAANREPVKGVEGGDRGYAEAGQQRADQGTRREPYQG
jgi:hypothetical protein